MDQYPRRLYLAASWRGLVETLTKRVARSLADKGFTLLGDHKVHESQETGRDLHWQQRVDDIISDCCGVVVVLPPDDAPQSTSPYILPEIMIAARQHLPLLLIHPGVRIQLTPVSGARILFVPAVGDPPKDFNLAQATKFPSLDTAQHTILSRDATLTDEVLAGIRSIDLTDCSSVMGPVEWQDNRHDHALDAAIDSFVGSVRDRPCRYVFHILPFARMPLHERVAATVFEEIGIPCVIAPYKWRPPAPLRQHWRQLLLGADMVVADLSESNRNCLFEAGAAAGMGRPLQLVRAGTAQGKADIPFGLDDTIQKPYESEDALAEIVRGFCLPYKRTVFNLTALDAETKVIPGVPEWYAKNARSGSSSQSVRLQAILSLLFTVLSCATAIQLTIPAHVPTFAALVTGPVTLLVLIARFLESAKSDLDDWFVARAKWIRNVALILGFLAVCVCGVVGLFRSNKETTSQQPNSRMNQPVAGAPAGYP